MNNTLQLKVSDFGPIVNATVDLRPMTVFVGPSNTGKSYLAILIYALHRHFGGHDLRWQYQALQEFMGPGEERAKTINALNEWIEQEIPNGKLLFRGSTIPPGPVRDTILSTIDMAGAHLIDEISRCFGIDDSAALIRTGSKDGAQIEVSNHSTNGLVPIKYELTVGSDESVFNGVIPEGTPIRIDTDASTRKIEQFNRVAEEMLLTFDLGPTTARRNSLARRMIAYLTDLVRPQILGPLHLPAFYLPASRTGVMHAHNVVVRALIASAAMTGLRPTARMPMLSGVLGDFLEQLIGFHQPFYGVSERRQDLGTGIEEAILGGSVHVEESEAIGYPHFTYHPDGWKNNLSLMHASSMVSELAPLVLYLRYIVGPGNVLIVEEPESHLHPAKQVEFTRQLALLIHSGIRVMITTHSEWFLEELANIVRRSEIPYNHHDGAVDDKVTLRTDQVGVWLFNPMTQPKGSVVTEATIDDAGLYSLGFDEVAVALHNEWADIGSQIEDS